MTQNPETLTRAYASRGVLVDTNLVLLWFVGQFDRHLLHEFKRTRAFEPEDYDVLTRYIGVFARKVTTPNVMTEVSNLAGQMGGKADAFYREVFVPLLGQVQEEYIASVEAGSLTEFARLGLTDSGIVKVVCGRYLLLTEDHRLAGFVNGRGGAAVNFNHLRGPVGWWPSAGAR